MTGCRRVLSLLRNIGLSGAPWLLALAVMMPSATAARADALVSWRAPSVPALRLPGLDGETVDLAAQGGRMVIVHFFATWCEPCRDELRSLERLAAAFAVRPFRILAVDVGEPAARVRRFLEREKIAVRYPVLIDFDKQAMRAWGVEILPTSYVLDAALCPLWKVAGALEWDVAPTLSVLEPRVAAREREAIHPKEESCIAKGGTQ